MKNTPEVSKTKKTASSVSDKERVDIIGTVKTPLGFFVLVVLVVEVVFGGLAGLSEGTGRAVLVYSMVFLIFFLVVIVAGMAIFRPEALRGSRHYATTATEVLPTGDAISSSDRDDDRQPSELTAPLSTFAKEYGVSRIGFFSDFTDSFKSLIEDAEEITLLFIHSRRWRENHDDSLLDFLARKNTRLTVFLPNLENELLLEVLKQHFDDGPNLKHFIRDAYRYFARFHARQPEKVTVRVFNLYPTYTFYRFDDKMVVAMYPNSIRRKSVPTFQIHKGGKYWDFVYDDIRMLITANPPLTAKALQKSEYRWPS